MRYIDNNNILIYIDTLDENKDMQISFLPQRRARKDFIFS